MNWIDASERRFGQLAIPHLIRVIAGFNALVFVLYKLSPRFLRWLTLDPAAVRHGEVWRLVSYIFIPDLFGGAIVDWVVAAFYILYLWWIGDGLEQAMGSFRVNLFYLTGIVGTTAAAFFTRGASGASLLNVSLLFAFAYHFPDALIYIFGVLPVKAKWMAWVSAGMVAFGFLAGSWTYRGAVVVALGNFILFFGMGMVERFRVGRQLSQRAGRYPDPVSNDEEALHRCHICGRTEHSSRDLDFRIARDGEEYCAEHLPKAKLDGTP